MTVLAASLEKGRYMRHSLTELTPGAVNQHLLLAYVADLELEVDRLRKQNQFVQHEVRGTLKQIKLLCTEAKQASNSTTPLGGIDQAARELAALRRDVDGRVRPGTGSQLCSCPAPK